MGGMIQIPKDKTFFFEDRPLFGMDIGHGMLRVMQVDLKKYKTPRLKGYGSITFDPKAIVNGVVEKPEIVAQAVAALFKKELVGDITTNRVAVSLPASRALTRVARFPKMSDEDIADAVLTEAEQNIPAHIDSLYYDYATLREDQDGLDIFLVAIPRSIVDSHLTLMRMLGLEAVLFDTTIGASARLFMRDKHSAIPSVLIDFGADDTYITIFNQGLVVTGTVAFGGDDITAAISKTLSVSTAEATMLKSQYGLSASPVQKQVVAAVDSCLGLLLKEVRRTIRYYEQRYTKEAPIGQIVIMGGGANLPGLAEYLTDHLRLATRPFDPSPYIDFGHLHPFYTADLMSYVTAAGLALTDPKEIFA